MGNHDRCTSFTEFIEGGLDLTFGCRVEGRSGFIKQYYFGIFEDCAGYGDALAFAAGEAEAAFADAGFVAVGEFEDAVVDLGGPCRFKDFCTTG